MPIKYKLTANAIPPQQANVVVGTVKTPLTATGTNQATALTLSLDDNHVFGTVASGTGAVLQASYASGDTIRVANHGANNLLLYPASGGSIANAAANAPLTIIPTGQAVLTSIDGPGKNWAATVSQAPGGSTGTVTSVSVVTANGVSGSVANPTTTPAITLALGAITPSSVAASGAMSGSNLSGTNTGDQTISDATISTSDITTNNVSISKHGFAPKSPNDVTKYLDGTGAYSVPPGTGGGGGTGAWWTLQFNQSISTFTHSFAVSGNLIGFQQNVTVYELGVMLTTVNTATYKIGIAPFNTSTNQITNTPTYSALYTEGASAGANRWVKGSFAGGFAMTAGSTYVLFIVRTDSTTTVSTTLNISTGNVSPASLTGTGIVWFAGSNSVHLASVAPTTSDTWSIESGFYVINVAYQFT